MTKAATKWRRGLSITPKDILCLPANLMKAWIDTINPRNICKRYAKSFKENRTTWVIALALLAFTGIRFAFMDFDLSVFGINNTMFAGGDTTEVLDKLKVSDKLAGDNILAVYNLFRPVGIALSVLYWLLMLVGLSVRDQFTTQQICIHMIRLIIPVYLINDKGYEIMKSLLLIGEGVATDLTSILSESVTGVDSGDMKVSLFNIIGALIPLFILWLVGMACKLVMMLTCFQRRIKIELMMAFAPLALADITGDQHSTSLRFCKNILALALQGAIILGMGVIAMKVLTSEFSAAGVSGGTSIVKMVADGTLKVKDCVPIVAVSLTVIGLYPKTEEISKAIIGA